MWCLLAEQTPNLATVQPSGNFSNPDSWANLARAIGVPAFLGLVILLLIAAGVFFVARWTVGPQGWAKRLAESFIDGLLGKLDSLNTCEQKQLDLCHRMLDSHLAPGGVCNLTDLRTAAQTTLGGLESLSDTLGAAEASKRFGEARQQIGHTPIVQPALDAAAPAGK